MKEKKNTWERKKIHRREKKYIGEKKNKWERKKINGRERKT